MSIFASNTGWFDLWTSVHLLFGFAFTWGLIIGSRGRAVGFGVALIVVLAVIWELFEVSQGPGGFGGSETGINLFWDIIAAVVGAWFAFFVARNVGHKNMERKS